MISTTYLLRSLENKKLSSPDKIRNMSIKDSFKFVVPAELSKGEDGEWRVRGLASTGAIDQQGETLIQKGIDLSPIDRKRGILNWDHGKGPENTIGILDGYNRTSKGLYIEGRLFKNHSKAKAVREIMESLGSGDHGRMGLSVEGKIIERDPSNPLVVRKCQISAVALTMNPVNTDTFADIVKSMNAAESLEIDAQETTTIDDTSSESTFTATQVLAIVQKALSTGSGVASAPNLRQGGDALAQESLDEKKKKEKTLAQQDGVKKGGDGSGVRGHKTEHSWGTMRVLSAKDHSHSVPVHPEHWKEIKDVHEGKKPSSSFTDETGKKWGVDKHPEGGVSLKHESSAGKFKHQLNEDDIKSLDDSETQKVNQKLGGPLPTPGHASRRRLRKMSKSLYKSNLTLVLDRLQTLYPQNSRDEIWEAVKERLNTKFSD